MSVTRDWRFNSLKIGSVSFCLVISIIIIILVHRIEKATSLKIIILFLSKEKYRLKQNTVVIAAKFWLYDYKWWLIGKAVDEWYYWEKQLRLKWKPQKIEVIISHQGKENWILNSNSINQLLRVFISRMMHHKQRPKI